MVTRRLGSHSGHRDLPRKDLPYCVPPSPFNIRGARLNGVDHSGGGSNPVPAQVLKHGLALVDSSRSQFLEQFIADLPVMRKYLARDSLHHRETNFRLA